MYGHTIDLTPAFAALGDASADRTLAAIEMGSRHMGNGYRHASVYLAVANVDTPVGAVKVFKGDNPDDMIAEFTITTAVAIASPTFSVQIDNLETNCRYISVMYDRTSGGSGAAITGTLSLSE